MVYLTWLLALLVCCTCVQLLFSSHSSLLDDKEHDNTDMEDSGIPLECVLSECTVSATA